MRLTVDLPYLKPPTRNSHAKYRRLVPAGAKDAFGSSAVEWTLGTSDPKEIVAAWEIQHARFEAMLARRASVSSEQIRWEKTLEAAIRHGLAKPGDLAIGPVDPELEQGRFSAFTAAILEEGDNLSPQRAGAKYANKPAPSAVELLLAAKWKGVKRPEPTLEDARKLYIEEKLGGEHDERRRKDVQRVNRAFVVVSSALGGGKTLVGLKRADAKAVRDLMLAQPKQNGGAKKASSVKREINIIKAVLNHAIREMDLTNAATNPFNGLEMPRQDQPFSDEELIDPLPPEVLEAVRSRILGRCKQQLALVWRILEGTGCRLAEVTGLRVEDAVTGGDTPNIRVEWHEDRRVKTKASIRHVPIAGDALEAVKEARQAAGNDRMLFPDYGKWNGPGNASRALMKHVRAVTENPRHVVHSLRHNMADWLVEAGVPEFERKLILGHALKDVGDRVYGGAPARLRATTKAMHRALAVKAKELEGDASGPHADPSEG